MGLKLRARNNLAGLKYRGGGPMLAFQLHRLTAIGILLFVGFHVLASFTSQETGANWAGVVNDIYMSAWFQILVAFCVIYHSINGIRISLLDFFPGFQDGSGLKLTTAQYYTPNGRVIQAKGIEPDIEVTNKIEDKGKPIQFLREKDLERHLENHEGERESEAEAPEEDVTEPEAANQDAQLTRAMEILKSWGIFEQMQREAQAVAMDDASTGP